MCICAVLLDGHPEFPFVLIHNRAPGPQKSHVNEGLSSGFSASGEQPQTFTGLEGVSLSVLHNIAKNMLS